MNKLFIHRMGLVCAVVLSLAMLLGCKPAATPPTGTVNPTGGTTTAPTPTAAGEVITWRCQSSASAGDATYWSQQMLCDEIAAASGGRLIWKLFPNGAIVSRNEQFDAVSSGAIECVPSVSENDWAGKDQLFELTSTPAGMSFLVEWLWENYTTKDDLVPPAEKLFDTLYQKFGMKSFNVGISSPEVEYLANKKIITPADYKGLTFRGAGWELEVISRPEFGAKPVFIATADIYSSLQTGVIDAFESSNPQSNDINGYADITKFWGFPGMHNFSQTAHMLVNMAKWKSLSPDLQKIVELAANAAESRTSSFAWVGSAKVLPSIQKKGITFIYESPEVQNVWVQMTELSAVDRGKTYPAFLTEYRKYKDFQYMCESYEDLMRPTYPADYPGRKENMSGITLVTK